MTFQLTAKQQEANHVLASDATHVLLEGGSRSGKTFLEVRAILLRAIKAPRSRHAILRHQFNMVKQAVVYDTYPKVLELCFPSLSAPVNKSDWFATLPNGSEIWFGGLDDKERTEKILGKEFATLLLNEAPEISWASRNLAITRLAQKVMVQIDGVAPYELPLKAYYDCNPPDKGHWLYRVFHQGVDPESRQPLSNRQDYAHIRLNPRDNLANLPSGYIATLQGLSARMQRRFLDGEYRDENPNALFVQEFLDKWRVVDMPLPDMQRIVVAVDPSGAGDKENNDNDAIGIVVAGLGTDGNGYVLEDLTVKAGPATWGKVAASAYDRHKADLVVGEANYGGEMVRFVVQTARPQTPFKLVTATRGKVVRAQPIAALCENGKVRLAGRFNPLEDELAGFTTNGYIGERSPNRADAFVWAMTALFPGMVQADPEPRREEHHDYNDSSWMAL